mgnify:CR=1 FL=1
MHALDQLRHLSVVHLAHLLNAQARLLHRVRDGHRLEVASMVDRLPDDVDQRVVGRRIELNLDLRVRSDQVARKRTEPLY